MKVTDNKDKQDAIDLAESSRETDWKEASFVAELFKGNFLWRLIHPFPLQDPKDKEIGDLFLKEVEAVLKAHVDPDQVDRDEELPQSAIDALSEKGLFGIKIDKKYGGLGLSITNYVRVMELVGSWCGTTAVWLSAHQSIGVPQPLKIFGTEAQKERYLPRLAKGAISAFALTEPNVGSDPAQMSTTATPSEDGSHYLINGDKLYITNGTAAELLVVMAVTPPKMVRGKEKKQITAFIVETNSPGFEIVHRCSFLGIRGIANGHLKFTNVKVPKENMIGNPGEGLKIALVTLNTGRLTIPAISAGVGKCCMRFCHEWANERVQWGLPIGKHQAVSERLSELTSNTFAMDSVASLTASFADHQNKDIRLEAAMAKYFGSEVSWKIIDDTLQTRGGRGFETAASLKARGETPMPIERMFRDLRINRIIEGTSDIMKLFIAREAMDVHVRHLIAMTKPGMSFGDKAKAFLKAVGFYCIWYPKVWLPIPQFWGTKHLSSKNRGHLRYINRTTRKLARRLFHTMARYQQKLEKEQLILGHYVDIGTLLFAMSASLSRADTLSPADHPGLQDAVDLFCKQSRKDIRRHFQDIRCHHRGLTSKVNTQFLKGTYEWMTTGIIKT